MKSLRDLLGRKLNQLFQDQDSENIVWAVYKMLEEIYELLKKIEAKQDLNLSTWEKMLEDEYFRSLSRETQELIWELAKIKENDSPKNQTELADRYGVSDAHVSQVKEVMERLGF